MLKTKPKTKLEKDLFRIIINWNPRRSPDGQVKAILRLFKGENAGIIN